MTQAGSFFWHFSLPCNSDFEKIYLLFSTAPMSIGAFFPEFQRHVSDICRMPKIDREAVFQKYGGFCAYTGKPLGPDW